MTDFMIHFLDGQNVNGWFVGFTETADNTYFFAANIHAKAMLPEAARRNLPWMCWMRWISGNSRMKTGRTEALNHGNVP